MPIEGFDYKSFAAELASQVDELIPADFQDFQKQYVKDTVRNFSTLSGEAVYNDEKLNFTAEQGMFITQIIAEWSYHKSVDIIKAGILPDYWDGVMQKIAFTIFEIAKQTIVKGLPQDEILQIVEHHVKKSYEGVLEELKERNVIDDVVFDRASHQSNIDEMMHQIQEEKVEQEISSVSADSQNSGSPTNSKVLKLASVAMLLKQMPQDKVQTILNKFNPEDAQAVIQYMQMNDLENKVDKNITMKCLHEIKSNLPEPKFISSDKILSKMNKVFEALPKENVDRLVSKERPLVKLFVEKARDGECLNLSSKVANLIAQHLEESTL